MNARPVLLFDVMDTLVHDPFNDATPAFFGTTRDELIAQKHPQAWIDFELGKIDEQEYLQSYFQDQRTFDHDAFRRNLANAYRWIPGAELLLGRLQLQGFEIHALSNYSVWYRTIDDRLSLSRFLQWTFVSCLTGVRKPAAAAYEGVADALGRPFDSLLFVDNSPENCHAAESVGIPTIHFTDIRSLCLELACRGVFA